MKMNESSRDKDKKPYVNNNLRVIPTAKNANVSIEQLSAAYVEMTKNGVSVNESTTLEYRVA